MAVVKGQAEGELAVAEGVDVGAGAEVFSDGFEVARGSGGMQGEFAAGESAFASQEFDDGLWGAGERDVERGLEHVGGGIDIGPGVQDGLNDILP